MAARGSMPSGGTICSGLGLWSWSCYADPDRTVVIAAAATTAGEHKTHGGNGCGSK
jgi:hypothetical protein